MSNEKQQPQPPKPERTYPVRKLLLRDKIALPIGGVTDTLLAVPEPNRARYAIEYIPSLRHHRVMYFGAGAKEPTSVMMFGESATMYWEPAQ